MKSGLVEWTFQTDKEPLFVMTPLVSLLLHVVEGKQLNFVSCSLELVTRDLNLLRLTFGVPLGTPFKIVRVALLKSIVLSISGASATPSKDCRYASSPATCAAAISVPDKTEVEVSLPTYVDGIL